MSAKPRYWQVAFPLTVIALCVAPNEFFLQNWMVSVSDSTVKLKVGTSDHHERYILGDTGRIQERGTRPYALNAILRLVWTYLYRCRESASTSVEKLEGILKILFPPNRTSIYPADEGLDPFICIVHFITFRHGDLGRSVILKLLQESTMTSSSSTVSQSELLAPDRMMIAIKAILLTLTTIEKDSPPTWPSSADFSSYNYEEDYAIVASFLPDLFYAKPDMQDFHDRYGPVISRIANICGATVGSMFVFEDRFSEQAAYASVEDRDLITIRTHGNYTVGFRRDLVPQIDLLRTVFESWPRCLHSSIPLSDMLDFLIRGVIHVDPTMSHVAAAALKRTAQSPRHSKAVMSRFTKFLFSAEHVQKEGAGTHLVVENSTILSLWESMVKEWSKAAASPQSTAESEEDEVMLDQQSTISVQSVVDAIEAGALFLLTYNKLRIRIVGTRTLKLLGKIMQSMNGGKSYVDLVRKSYTYTHLDEGSGRPQPVDWALDILRGKNLPSSFLEDNDKALDQKTRDRLNWWKENTAKEKILRLAEGEDPRDQRIWAFVLPSFIRIGLDHQPGVIGLFREALSSAVLRFHPLMASLAGIGGKAAPPSGVRSPIPYRQTGIKEAPRVQRERSLEDSQIIGQWQTWLSMLCATAVQDPRSQFVREHTRAQSEVQSMRERLYSPKGLFRLVIPFLTSDHSIFRSAVVTALSCIHQSAFKSLLEDLQGITRHIYDDNRNKASLRNNSQDRLHTAVAQVYQLTAHFIKYPRAMEEPTALNLLLGFVRETTLFLRNPAVREDLELQRLRRFFCGVVENLFDGLAAVKEEDTRRWLSPNQRLSLYRLCEEWCSYGGDSMRRHYATGSYDRGVSSQSIGAEAEQLSAAAAGAMAALCVRL